MSESGISSRRCFRSSALNPVIKSKKGLTMVLGLTLACVLISCFFVACVGLYIKSRMDIVRLSSEIKRFGEIGDIEQYNAFNCSLSDILDILEPV